MLPAAGPTVRFKVAAALAFFVHAGPAPHFVDCAAPAARRSDRA